MENYLKLIKSEWTHLIDKTDDRIRLLAAEVGKTHAHILSQEFYRIVLTDPHAEEFLSNEQVERHLKSALEKWIIDVLTCQVSDIDKVIAIQQHVASIHARIGISVEIVEMGFRVLKNTFPRYQFLNSRGSRQA